MFIKYHPNFKNSVYFEETEEQHSSLFKNIVWSKSSYTIPFSY